MLEELESREVVKNPKRVTADLPHEITYATLEDLLPLLVKSKACREKSDCRTTRHAEEPELDGVELPEEVSTAQAARILGVSKDTVLKLKEGGLLEYRNTGSPGSSRPVYAFSLRSVLEVRTTYQRDTPPYRTPKTPHRHQVKGKRQYKHFTLSDEQP
jgi:hypothetical protein